MMAIQKGQIVALFAFDIGEEIDLERLRQLTAAVPAQPISRRSKRFWSKRNTDFPF
jgi:hypothetical protein